MDLRELERESIRAFVQSAADDGYLSGRVLDYGCGKQPYRGIVEAVGGEYVGYDSVEFPANVSGQNLHWPPAYTEEYDAVLCTQVLQYVPDEFDSHEHESVSGVWRLLDEFNGYLNPARTHREPAGHLVLTYPTNWPEVEPEDLHRFTKAGMERLLTEAGFEIIDHRARAQVRFHDQTVIVGYGVIARA